MSTQVTRKPNQVIFDIQKSNMTQLLDPNKFDHFTESVYHAVNNGCDTDSMDKFESTIDHIDITFSGPEAEEIGMQNDEVSNVDNAVINSFWEINRAELNNIMLACNISKDLMDEYILHSLAILDMSPQDRKTRLYRINLHP